MDRANKTTQQALPPAVRALDAMIGTMMERVFDSIVDERGAIVCIYLASSVGAMSHVVNTKGLVIEQSDQDRFTECCEGIVKGILERSQGRRHWHMVEYLEESLVTSLRKAVDAWGSQAGQIPNADYEAAKAVLVEAERVIALSKGEKAVDSAAPVAANDNAKTSTSTDQIHVASDPRQDEIYNRYADGLRLSLPMLHPPLRGMPLEFYSDFLRMCTAATKQDTTSIWQSMLLKYPTAQVSLGPSAVQQIFDTVCGVAVLMKVELDALLTAQA